DGLLDLAVLLEDLRGSLDIDRRNKFDEMYFTYFVDFFDPPNKEEIDVDDTIRSLQKEVLRAAEYSSDSRVRVAKRLFIERAQNLLPGVMLVGTDWRVIHDEFEDLEKLAPSGLEGLVSRLHRLRLDIHNVLHPRVLADAEKIYEDIQTEGHPFYIKGKTRLHHRLGELVMWLERMYKDSDSQAEDLRAIKEMMEESIRAKWAEAFQTAGIEGNVPGEFAEMIERIQEQLTDSQPIGALVEIEKLRYVIQGLLANPAVNGEISGVKELINKEERLILIRIELALERMESGLVGIVAQNEDLRHESIYDFARWLQTTLLIAKEYFPDLENMIPRAQLFLEELQKKNMTAARDLWLEIRAAISEIKARRLVLSFRLFEYGAQQIDHFFFRDEMIPLAPGTAHGRARIIIDYESEHELEKMINDPVDGIWPGDVLVLRDIPRVINIAPGHEPAGIIVEEGSVASHASSAIRQRETPIPAIVVKGIRNTLNEYDIVRFVVPPSMDAVKVTTRNLKMKDITAKVEKRAPNAIVDGWAQGYVKVLRDTATTEEFEAAWKDASIGPDDLVVIDSLDYVNLDYILETHGYPAGIIVSKGNRLSYMTKVVMRTAHNLSVSIPVLQLEGATTLFNSVEGKFFGFLTNEYGTRLYWSKSDDLRETQYFNLEPEKSGVDGSMGSYYLYNTRVVVANIGGNYSKFSSLSEEIADSYGEAPMLYLGDYIGEGSSGVTLLEKLLEPGGRVETGEDIIVLGNRESLFLRAMLGDLNDLREFLLQIGFPFIQEAGLSFPDDLKNLTEQDLLAFKNNPRLSFIAQRLLQFGKVYHRENDTLFVHSGIPLTEEGDTDDYLAYDGKEYSGILALKQMQKDFRENTLFFLRRVFERKTPVFCRIDAETGGWQDRMKEHKFLEQIEKKFFVKRITAAGQTKGKFRGKVLDLQEGA
ncbi:MAG: hypothetical protein Q8Q33_02875, partial [Chlamydiota bacterium]|nr:hypothetical protein [Chlamydiota bacterium]